MLKETEKVLKRFLNGSYRICMMQSIMLQFDNDLESNKMFQDVDRIHTEIV